MFISLLEMLHIFCNYGPIITLIWHCLYITLFLLLTPYQNISTSKTCLPYPFYSPSNSSVFKVLVKIQIRNLVFWINEKKNHIETPEGIVSYIHSYKSLEKKNLLLEETKCWFWWIIMLSSMCCVNIVNHWSFFFIDNHILYTLKRINLKYITMNCFLFYFQKPIKSQPLIIKCPINAKYHSSGQQSIPNHKDGITVNRLKKYFLILSCIHKTVTEQK